MTSLVDWAMLTWSFGMDTVLAQPAAQDLGGPVGDDLVDIHIVAGAGAGLEGIHDKLVVPFAFDHFLGGLADGARRVRRPAGPGPG